MKNKCYGEQVSKYDCGPTAFVNALIYLFKRSDIPSLAIRHIYKDTLDRRSIGTSFDAMTKLAKWLKSYKKGNFSLETHIKKANDVVFRGRFLTTKTLCGILFVYFDRTCGHFITVIYEMGEHIYCFDPYPRVEKCSKDKEWEWLNPHKFNGCNLRIKRDYINELKSYEIFRAGVEERYFVLIRRCKKCRNRNQESA